MKIGNITISEGNDKIGNTPNVSLLPIITCPECTECKKDCYALKFARMYPGVLAAWADNTLEYYKSLGSYFLAITTYLREKKPKYFRWHVGGDIPDMLYFIAMIAVARVYSNTRFLAYTKNTETVSARLRSEATSPLPKNLSIIVSRWKGDKEDPALTKGLPQAWVHDPSDPDTRIPKRAIKCKGTCMDCRVCWNLKPGQSVVFEKH